VSCGRILHRRRTGSSRRVATDGGKSMREAGVIRFVKMAVFSGVQQLFFVRKATTSGRIQLLKYTRFVSSVYPLYLQAVEAGGVTHGGNFQKVLDNSFQVAAVGWVQPVICGIAFYE